MCTWLNVAITYSSNFIGLIYSDNVSIHNYGPLARYPNNTNWFGCIEICRSTNNSTYILDGCFEDCQINHSVNYDVLNGTSWFVMHFLIPIFAILPIILFQLRTKNNPCCCLPLKCSKSPKKYLCTDNMDEIFVVKSNDNNSEVITAFNQEDINE